MTDKTIPINNKIDVKKEIEKQKKLGFHLKYNNVFRGKGNLVFSDIEIKRQQTTITAQNFIALLAEKYYFRII